MEVVHEAKGSVGDEEFKVVEWDDGSVQVIREDDGAVMHTGGSNEFDDFCDKYNATSTDDQPDSADREPDSTSNDTNDGKSDDADDDGKSNSKTDEDKSEDGASDSP